MPWLRRQGPSTSDGHLLLEDLEESLIGNFQETERLTRIGSPRVVIDPESRQSRALWPDLMRRDAPRYAPAEGGHVVPLLAALPKRSPASCLAESVCLR